MGLQCRVVQAVHCTRVIIEGAGKRAEIQTVLSHQAGHGGMRLHPPRQGAPGNLDTITSPHQEFWTPTQGDAGVTVSVLGSKQQKPV